jgi:gamma-glutamyltranspeptidase/glutathione hydrolase
LEKYPASVAQVTQGGTPYEAGDILKQPELAKTLTRIAERGPAGFYEGETAELLVGEMQAGGGIITKEDLKGYVARKRQPIRGNYRGYEIISMPPPSSGGVTLVEMLNILEGYDLAEAGFGAARNIHRYVEAMRRAYEDRAQYLGDPDANPRMPIQTLTSKHYAKRLRNTISESQVSKSAPDKFDWRPQSPNTTHLSVVDSQRNAVALTYTLEQGYGSAIVVPGAGFLLNNEMGDFNPVPGLTNGQGLIGTDPNLTAPGKRMLSSMTPTIVAKDGQPFMVTGTPGGRTIINTVLQTILNVVDFGMNAQEAVDAGRIHHQWLPDEVWFERLSLSPDTVEILERLGHTLVQKKWSSAAQVIVVDRDQGILEGGSDRRVPDGAAVGY